MAISPAPSVAPAFGSSADLFAVAAPAAKPALAPETLHPRLWRANALGAADLRRGPAQTEFASGYAELDDQLPGGGWPPQALTELLLPHPGIGELRLLAPALARIQAQQRVLMWFDPPAVPCAWTLGALGIDPRHLVLLRARQVLKTKPGREQAPAADILWALEQALKSGHLGAALAWLPSRLPGDALRRLQLAAQAHEGPVFLLRDVQHQDRPSPAPLRLVLGSAGPDLLQVRLLKRRGPPLLQPLTLALAPVLPLQDDDDLASAIHAPATELNGATARR